MLSGLITLGGNVTLCSTNIYSGSSTGSCGSVLTEGSERSPPEWLDTLQRLTLYHQLFYHAAFPGGSAVKNPSANAGNASTIPGSGRSPGEGNGKPCQYSCLGNPMDTGAWQAIVRGVTKEPDMT